MSGVVRRMGVVNICGVAVLAVAVVGTAVLFGGSATSQERTFDVADSRLASVLEDKRVLRPEELVSKFDSGVERVRVIVSLRESAAIAGFNAWGDAFEEDAMRAEVSILQNDALARLSAGSFEVRWLYENQPAFSGTVTTQGLVELLEDPNVRHIDPVFEVEINTRQGIPVINASGVRTTVDGSGLAIAICDTGIDYNHSRLGGGGFPNGKVIGGWDFGDGDSNPLDQNGHGTSVAAVAAGDGPDSGDYIGGVAPGARLYALKMSPGSSGSASTADMVASWDWCLTHRNDDPNNPMKVVNTSFGGGEHSSTCDGVVPSMTNAANSLRNAGVTVVVSSGNEGLCSATGWPACINSVMAIGAVYDANIGGPGWCVSPSSCVGSSNGGCSSGFACFDNTTTADQVTCYSNSANFLSVLAPSNNARVPAIGGGFTDTFGGTSTAAPYTAGAAALVQDYAATLLGGFLSASDVRNALESTGDSITDPKAGLSFPRVNVQAAVDSLSVMGDDCTSPFVVGNGLHAFSTIGATTDGPTESGCGFCCGDEQINQDIWFRYTASCNGTVTASLCNSDYDTKIAVYAGTSCPTANSAIACNDDFCNSTRSETSFIANAGSAYLIRVGGFQGEVGTGTLDISCEASNDDCIGADTVTNGVTAFDTTGATTDGPNEAGCSFCCGDEQINQDKWYRYTATCTGTLTVSLCGSSFDTKLALYRGFGCPGAGSAAACNDDFCSLQSETSMFVEVGDPVLIRVGGYDDEEGPGTMTITCEDTEIDQCQGIDGVNTLRVNFDNGTGSGHLVSVVANASIIVDIAKPAAGGNGKFLVHMNAGLPTSSSIQTLPASLGPSCFNFLVSQGGTPVSIWNSIGKTNQVGSSNYFGTPIADPGRAPQTFLILGSGDPANIPPGSAFTFQGVIINPAATSPKGASVTNAVGMIVE